MRVNFLNDENFKKQYLSYSLVGYHQIVSDIVKSINLNDSIKVNLTQARNGNTSSETLIRDFIFNFLKDKKQIADMQTTESIEIITQEILDEVVGYGPLNELFKTIKKQDVFCNGHSNIKYLDKDNNHVDTVFRFRDEQHFDNFINRLLDSVNESLTPINPHVAVTMPDGTRIAALHKDITGYTTAVFRFHPKTLYTFEEQLNNHTFDEVGERILKSFVNTKQSGFVYGDTGSGKTSIIGTLEHFTYTEGKRFVSISKTNEHRFRDKFPDANCIEMSPKSKGHVDFNFADCLKAALVYRFDYIYFNELLDSAIFTLLDALSTGHSGMSGLHGEDMPSVINRIISLTKEYNPTFSDSYCVSKLNTAIYYFVEMKSFGKGKRVYSINWLEGFNGIDPIVIPLYSFDEKTDTWTLHESISQKALKKIISKYSSVEKYFNYLKTGVI